MSWKDLKDAKANRGNFVKLRAGDSVEGVFLGEPYSFYRAFKETAEHTTWAEGRQFKFRLNFAIKGSDGAWSLKIFEGGGTIADQLVDAQDEYGMDCVYKIKRTGSTKDDTRYALLFKKKLTPDESLALNAIPLLKLTRARIEDSGMESDFLPPDDGDIPLVDGEGLPF